MSRYDSRTLAAIHEALDDEYKARATYEAVISKFGPVRPFTNIIGAEERHAQALERLLQRAGEPIPADPWRGTVTAPDTLAESLALGVQAEIDNRDLYSRLNAMTSAPEVLRVFANLQRASQDNHLPAFQRRLDRLTGQPAMTDPALPQATASSPASRARGGGAGMGRRSAGTSHAMTQAGTGSRSGGGGHGWGRMTGAEGSGRGGHGYHGSHGHGHRDTP